jgi:hypothetical protein
MQEDVAVEQRSGPSEGTPRGPGPCGRLVVSVTMAGGLVGGGGVVALIGYLHPESTHLLLGVVPPLFGLGAVAGFFHGVVLAYLGRPLACSSRIYWSQVRRGALWSMPGVLVAGLIAFWTAYTSTLAGAGRTLWLLAVVGGWVTGAVVCAWASIEASRALLNVLRRWPEQRLGLVLLAVTFGVFLYWLGNLDVHLQGLDFRLSPVAAVPVALALTLWVAAPVETLLLHMVYRRLKGAGA